MDDTTSLLPMVVISDKEGAPGWDKFETPFKLIEYIAGAIGVDPTKLSNFQFIYIGPDQPDYNSIWINNEGDPFIGIPINGSFEKIYKYPVKCPFVATDQSILVGGSQLRQVTESEVTSWGLPQLSGSAFWAILDIVGG